MYDEELDKPAQPKAWNLCDDLGQIEYIFSDKTGTLTSNVMDFKRASIDGIIYGRSIDQKVPAATQKKERDEMIERFSQICSTKYFDKNAGFVDPSLPQHLIENGIQAGKIREFFSLLSVCHSVMIEKSEDDDPNKILYRAQSPDEAALVSAAKNVGFACLKRSENKVEVNILGESRIYTILNILEFNSDRKRMSVIMKRPEGEIILLCKGADSVIFERLSKANHEALLEDTAAHLQMFANEGKKMLNSGLRTLCLAFRVIDHIEYEEWATQYKVAQSQINDREKACDDLAEMIEKEMTLMGATAIEDKLQEGVPESIEILSKAGIKLWVLTVNLILN